MLPPSSATTRVVQASVQAVSTQPTRCRGTVAGRQAQSPATVRVDAGASSRHPRVSNCQRQRSVSRAARYTPPVSRGIHDAGGGRGGLRQGRLARAHQASTTTCSPRATDAAIHQGEAAESIGTGSTSSVASPRAAMPIQATTGSAAGGRGVPVSWPLPARLAPSRAAAAAQGIRAAPASDRAWDQRLRRAWAPATRTRTAMPATPR